MILIGSFQPKIFYDSYEQGRGKEKKVKLAESEVQGNHKVKWKRRSHIAKGEVGKASRSDDIKILNKEGN